MTIQEAMQKAVEGGYKSFSPDITWKDWADIMLNPLFWQALGKSMGWKVSWYDRNIPGWHYQMLKLIDHLAEGKSIEDYFKSL